MKDFTARVSILSALIGVFVLASGTAFGQHQVSGTVTDSIEGSPLPGANVVVDGTTTGTTTDEQGQYQLTVSSPTDTLVFSFVGYREKRIPIRGRSQIDVALAPGTLMGEELVVVGYGQQREESVSGSISEVESEQLEQVGVANNTDKLAGRVPGLVTRQTSGRPGGDYRNLFIRGFGNPLVLVDGVEMRMSQIDPSTIESISVLKDASAAIYGMRAGNGVILVETKRGSEEQEPRLNYSSTVSVQSPTRVPNQVTAGQMLEMRRDGILLYGGSETDAPDQQTIECYKTTGQAEGCGDAAQWQSYDWYEATYQNWSPQQEHSLSAQGGTDRINYFVAGGFLDQKGAFEEDGINFRRWNGRSNLDVDVSENIAAAMDLSYRREIRKNPTLGGPELWDQVQKANPTYRTSLPDTNLIPVANAEGQSPLGATSRDAAGFDDSVQDYLNGRIELEWDTPVEGMSASGELSYFFQSHRNRDYSKPFEVYEYIEETGEVRQAGVRNGTYTELEDNSYRLQRFKPLLQLDYSNSFGPHTLEGLAIAEWITETDQWLGASRREMLSEDLPYIDLGADNETKDNFGSRSSEGRQSYAGRLQYIYDNRYILEATMRADGSYKFAPGSRWGYFPSVSAAWRLSEEDFLQGTDFDDLKLRASYSQTGDDRAVSPFQFLAGFSQTGSYIIGDSPQRRISPTSVPVTSVSWLENTQYNIGVDARLWNGLLGFEADVYYRLTEGRFAPPQRDIPATVGAQIPQQNINDTADRGIDLSLSHENTIGEVYYSVSPNFSFTRRKRVSWAEEEYDTEWERRVFQQEGKWARRTVGYVATGLFRSQEEIDNWDIDQDQQGNSTLKPGDIKYEDLNGDGVIDQKDQKTIGAGGTPNINYGMSFDVEYEGVALSGLLQGASMYDINMAFRTRGGFAQDGTPYSYHYEHRWTEENAEDAKLPATYPSGAVNPNNSGTSTFWLKDGTYLRLKNLNLSYSFQGDWVERVGAQRLRVSLSGTNILTFDRLGIFSGAFDPEGSAGGYGNQSGRGYPLHKTYSVSVDLSF
jgi:TonB-linked SusC/RagA family outer membrane protein